MPPPKEPTVIQHVYDLIRWYGPVLYGLPRDHKLFLGNRILGGLYDMLEQLIRARYSKDKLGLLRPLNTELEILRYQTRLLYDFSS